MQYRAIREATFFCNLADGYKKSIWIFEDLRIWMYPIENIWESSKSSKKQSMRHSLSARITSLEITPEYARDV